VEKPPVDMEERVWQAASNASIGPAQRRKKPARVSPK